MKYILAIFILLSLFIPTVVYATTDNVTWVATDNFTASVTANVSFPDDIALTELVTELDDLSDTVGAGIYSTLTVMLMIAFAFLAFWKRDTILHLIAGLLFIFYGFDMWSNSHVLSVGIAVAGLMIAIRGYVTRKKEA